MVDSTLPTRKDLIKLLQNIHVFDQFINSNTSDDITTPDGGVISPLQALSSIIHLITNGKLPSSSLYDSNTNLTQDVINSQLLTLKANASDVYLKSETLSAAQIKALYPDITNFLATVKQQVADWLTNQDDTTLSEVLESVVQAGISKGTIGGNFILNVPSVDALAKLQTWDGRTVYVDSDYIYVYSQALSKWIKQTLSASTIIDLPNLYYNKTQVDAAIANAAPKGTSLADYNIGDAYTKAQTQQLINNTISSVITGTVSATVPDLAPLAATYINIAIPGITTAMKPLLAMSGSSNGCMVSVSVIATGMVCINFFNYTSNAISLGTQSFTVTALETIAAITPSVKYISGTASYSEVTLAPYANYSYTLNITGIALGMSPTINLSTATSGLFINPTITASNTLVVNVFNPTSTTLTLSSGTAYVGAITSTS